MKNILKLFIAASFGMAISANAIAQSAIGGAAPKNAGMGAVSPAIKGKCLMGHLRFDACAQACPRSASGSPCRIGEEEKNDLKRRV